MMKRRLFITLLATFLMPFVMLAQSHVSHVTDTTSCGPFTWSVNGQNYTSSTTTSMVSGDTLYILHLVVNPVYEAPVCTTAVNGGCTFTFGDSIINTNGIHTATLQTVAGCDSVACINLTVSTSATASYTVTACASYNWHGFVYTNDTVIVNKHETDSYGCDSVLSLNLTIINPVQLSSDTVVDGCDLVYFRFSPGFPQRIQSVTSTSTLSSETFATPGTNFYNSFHRRTVDQCFDSVRTAHINVYYTTYVPQQVKACDSYTFTVGTTDHDYTYNVAADTIRVGRTTHSCDSSVILNVTINKSPVVSIEGDLSVTPGSEATLTAICDQTVNLLWSYQNKTTESITIPNVTANFDVSITATNTATGCIGENFVTILANEGINDVEASALNIYPNPATTSLNVAAEGTIANITIYNAMGQRVLSTDRVEGAINLAGLTNGTYTMRVMMADGHMVVRNFVVMK